MANLNSRRIKTLAWSLIVLVGIVVLALVTALPIYPSRYVFRLIAWENSDAIDWQKFPEHRLDQAGLRPRDQGSN